MPTAYVLAESTLKRQIQVGQTTIPLGLIPVFIACFAVVMGLNLLYLSRYRRIVTYLQRNHADLYEQVRRKPDVGPLYSKTYNPSKALIALSKQSHTFNDPRLETMLAEFVQFDRTFVLFSSVVIVVMLLVVLVVSLVLMG